MKNSRYLLILLVIFGMLLVACGGSTEEPAEEPATTEETTTEETVEEEPAAEEEVVEEETMEEEAVEEEPAEEEAMEEEEMGEADLDGGFANLLSGMEAYNTIGIDALNEMMVEEPPFLLDVRGPGELEENGWIEGAVNIPLRDLGDNLQYLPSFDTTIVSYCGSGWRCTIALTALEALGWENVLGLKGGSFGGWVEAGYPIVEGELPELVELNAASPDPAMVAAMTEMFQAIPDGYGGISADDLSVALIENPDIVLIDVRRTEEPSEKGYIDYDPQVHFPLETFVDTKADWPTDMDTPIVVYCGSGHRSTMAMTMLWAYGYTDVHSLKGGFGGWASAGFASVGVPEPEMEEMAFDMDAAFQTFLDGMERYNTIRVDDLNLLIVEDNAPFLLDVRGAGELEENGWIEGAVNIPLREVADNVQYLPSFDTPIVSYCGSGWRCTIALTALEAMGWEDVTGLVGGSYGAWVDAGYPIVEGELPELVELNEAEPDPAAVAAMQTMLQNVPDGFGVITADDFNLVLLETPDVNVIDVRRLEELEENGVIEAENWTHVPLESFVEMKDMWPAEMDAQTVVYCGSGHRSTIAMTILWSYGYSDVRSLRGGFGGWVDAGYPSAEYTP
jgi:rhodanese-related sulfurtransferase